MPELLESLAILNNLVVPCKEGERCLNSPSNCIQPKCLDCRLSENCYQGATRHYWKSNGYHTHPVLEKEKRDAKRAKAVAKQKANKAKDPAKQARLRAAERAERRTNAEIIKATRNSGRVNRDGDHLLYDSVVLDTKLQSKTETPVVHLHELDKVRADALRNGRALGVLCIKNRNGRAVCVLEESDFAALLAKAHGRIRETPQPKDPDIT